MTNPGQRASEELPKGFDPKSRHRIQYKLIFLALHITFDAAILARHPALNQQLSEIPFKDCNFDPTAVLPRVILHWKALRRRTPQHPPPPPPPPRGEARARNYCEIELVTDEQCHIHCCQQNAGRSCWRALLQGLPPNVRLADRSRCSPFCNIASHQVDQTLGKIFAVARRKLHRIQCKLDVAAAIVHLNNYRWSPCGGSKSMPLLHAFGARQLARELRAGSRADADADQHAASRHRR